MPPKKIPPSMLRRSSSHIAHIEEPKVTPRRRSHSLPAPELREGGVHEPEGPIQPLPVRVRSPFRAEEQSGAAQMPRPSSPHKPPFKQMLGKRRTMSAGKKPVRSPEIGSEQPIERPDVPPIIAPHHVPLEQLPPDEARRRVAAQQAHNPVQHVLDLYQEGLLMVSTVQRKDLAKMHNRQQAEAVAQHTQGGRMQVGDQDLAANGALAYAKTNWGLTGPRMTPHYFGMKNEADDTPLQEGGIGFGPRIGTLTDPRLMGARFIRGKEGRADFSEWDKDQASSKKAGVENDAPLFDYFSDENVRNKLRHIKTLLEPDERGTLRKEGAEINTLGFPPEAVVGFIATANNPANINAIKAAIKAMAPEQRQRRFPVFTWRRATDSAESPWQLVPLATVGGDADAQQPPVEDL